MKTNSPKTLIKNLGQSSLLVVFTIFLAVLAGYLVYKVQGIDTRLKEVESIVGGGAQAQPTPKPLEMAQVKGLFKKGNITFGDTNAKALVVEFSDPSCPYCHAAAYGADEIFQGRFKTVENGGTYQSPVQNFRKLAEEGKIGYALLYANGHGNGELAAQALYCAYDQGKYWESHDLLYSKAGYDLINDTVKNDVAKGPLLVDFLATVVDTVALQACLDNKTYAPKLAADMQTAQSLGFGGTPMFIVNTQRFPGAYNFTDIEPTLTDAMK